MTAPGSRPGRKPTGPECGRDLIVLIERTNARTQTLFISALMYEEEITYTARTFLLMGLFVMMGSRSDDSACMHMRVRW